MSVRVEVVEVPPDASGIPASAAEAWAALEVECPDASVFASLDVAEAVRVAYGWSYRVALAYEEERLRGALVAFERRRGPFRLCVMPPYVAYLPLLLPPRVRRDYAAVHARRDVLTALLRAGTSEADRVAVHLPPDVADVRGPVWDGFAASPLYTFEGEIPDTAEAMAARWSSSRRNLWRQHRESYTIRRAPRPKIAAAMSAESYARAGRNSVDAETLVRELEERGRLIVLEVQRDGATEAAAAFLVRESVAGYWLVGSERGPAMAVLAAEAAPHLSAKGCHRLDFVGANTPSIAEFKRSLGGALVPYFRLTRTPSRALRALEAAGRSIG